MAFLLDFFLIPSFLLYFLLTITMTYMFPPPPPPHPGAIDVNPRSWAGQFQIHRAGQNMRIPKNHGREGRGMDGGPGEGLQGSHTGDASGNARAVVGSLCLQHRLGSIIPSRSPTNKG